MRYSLWRRHRRAVPLRENYFLDDGAYIIVKLLVALVEARREGKTLNELIANLKEPCESAEARLNVLLDDTADYTRRRIRGNCGKAFFKPSRI